MARGVLILMGFAVLALAGGAAQAGEDAGMKISPSHDLSIPQSWAGLWRITTTYRRDTGAVWAVDDMTDVIRAGEPLGLSALTRGGLATCTGIITDRRLEASCARQFDDGACHVEGLVRLALERDGDMLAGAGEASGIASGGCGALPAGTTRSTVDLVGIRLSGDSSAPGRTLVPLPTRFVASVPLLTLLANSPQVRPVIVDDCKDEAWRDFVSPSFKNQGQCIKFVHEQEKTR